jgi:F-type H+-transporting ATPase subunit b
MILHINNIANLVSGHGFGINTNIFETNVINLAVVIAVVIVVGGNALRQLLHDRKQRLLDNLAAAERKVQQLDEELKRRQQQLVEAKARAEDLRLSGRIAADRRQREQQKQTQLTIARLLQFNKDTQLTEAEKKAHKVLRQIMDVAVEIAKDKIEKIKQDFESEDDYHQWVMDHKMEHWATITERVRRLQ